MASPYALDRDWEHGVVGYPDPAVEIVDDRFRKYRIGNAVIERLYTGARWSEGPVWFGDARCLIWSDIPNDRMLRWDEESGAVTIFRKPANFSNGNTRDRQGRLVTCEHLTRRVTRTEYDGRITVLADNYQGKRFNAPNDVIVHSDGSVWFTDPGYGTLLDYEGEVAEHELPTAVYRIDPVSGKVEIVADDFAKPNGLCFSPDESRLYVVDTGITHDPNAPSHIRVFDVQESGGKQRLVNGRVFADMRPGFADGVRTDMDGNLWAGCGWAGPEFNGVRVFAPDGDVIGKIHLPEPCANLCFGGRARKRLFMAASQSLYALYVEAQGAMRP